MSLYPGFFHFTDTIAFKNQRCLKDWRSLMCNAHFWAFWCRQKVGNIKHCIHTDTHTFSICHFSTLLCQELNMARCAEKNHFNLSSQAHLQAIGKVCYAPGYSLFYPHPWIAYLFADWNSRSWFCIHIYLYIALALYVCVWVCVLAPKRAKLWNGLMFLMTPPLCTKRLWSSHE